MPRRILSLGLALVAACSGEDEPAASSFRGTIAGATFVPTDAAGFVMEPRPCAEFGGVFGATPNATIVQVVFGDYPVCGLATDHDFCGVPASARGAYVAVGRENVYGGAVPPIEPGTYTEAGTGTADENGVVNFLWMAIGVTDAACASVRAGMPKEAAGGSLTLDEIGPTRLRGSATIAFDNGDVLSGTFDVPICDASDAAMCTTTEGCPAVTCVP